MFRKIVLSLFLLAILTGCSSARVLRQYRSSHNYWLVDRPGGLSTVGRSIICPMILFPALLFDLLFGDPPNRFHPTAWMGNLIYFLLRFRPRGNSLLELLYGSLIILIGVSLTSSIGLGITYIASLLPLWAGILLQALFLKLTISLRGLDQAAKKVQDALQNENLPEARRLLSWHLVSRDTSTLSQSQVSAAAIESVAENTSDGIIAPLFFYVIGGLPAAFAYRFANTADSMMGYHDKAREWLGKFPARLDDVLNFIPARLTGLFIILAAPLCGASLPRAWKIMWRDSSQTASPNAGIPMSAMAGALGVELEKVGHYQLGKGLRYSAIHDLIHARRILCVSVIVGVFFLWIGSLYV